MNISHTSCLKFCCPFKDHKCLTAATRSAEMVFFSFMASRGKHSVAVILGRTTTPGYSQRCLLPTTLDYLPSGTKSLGRKNPGGVVSRWPWAPATSFFPNPGASEGTPSDCLETMESRLRITQAYQKDPLVAGSVYSRMLAKAILNSKCGCV